MLKLRKIKYILLFTSVLFLTSCVTYYREVYYVEKVPISLQDTIIYKAEHHHYCDPNGNWLCVETEPDTFALTLNDTMIIRTLDCVYKDKEYGLKWLIGKNK